MNLSWSTKEQEEACPYTSLRGEEWFIVFLDQRDLIRLLKLKPEAAQLAYHASGRFRTHCSHHMTTGMPTIRRSTPELDG